MFKKLDAENTIKRNLKNPPAKDTIALPNGGFAVLRFVAKNPGIWMFHCHIDFHSELGMTLIFKVGEQSEFPKLPDNFPKCGSEWSQGIATPNGDSSSSFASQATYFVSKITSSTESTSLNKGCVFHIILN